MRALYDSTHTKTIPKFHDFLLTNEDYYLKMTGALDQNISQYTTSWIWSKKSIYQHFSHLIHIFGSPKDKFYSYQTYVFVLDVSTHLFQWQVHTYFLVLGIQQRLFQACWRVDPWEVDLLAAETEDQTRKIHAAS